ncbi:hypothetical protein EV401DRAFT_1903622 [Pisolithus croceorrhizus]|nr:hypothetical protein EV401DRAFT_1903622 [Pisolithus croceorrhizus]
MILVCSAACCQLAALLYWSDEIFPIRGRKRGVNAGPDTRRGKGRNITCLWPSAQRALKQGCFILDEAGSSYLSYGSSS